MNIRVHWGLVTGLACASVLALGAFAGCSSDNNAVVTSSDAAAEATTTPDASSGTDAHAEAAASEGGSPEAGSGDAGDAGVGDAGPTPRATAGLAASPFPIPTAGLTTAQIEQIGRGSYIVNVVSSCPDCHNNPAPDTLPGKGFLAGGNQFGPVQARNLTTDPTHGLRMTEAQFLEVLQTGKDQRLSPDGGAAVSLIVMPWEDFRWMSTTDLKAVYAYLQTVPADTNDVTPTAAGGPPLPLPTTDAGAPIFTDGQQATPPTLPDEASDAPLFAARGRAVQALNEPATVASLSAADQAAYGRGAYLVAQAICYECHTNPERLTPRTSTKFNTAQWLTGGRVFQTPAGLGPVFHTNWSMTANLLGATRGFIFKSGVNEQVFTTTIGTHVHGELPTTPQLAWPMPQGFTKLVAEDIHALWTYLSNQTPISGANDKATQGAVLYCSAATDAGPAVACPTGSTCDQATNSCVPNTCTTDADCRVCQTCQPGVDGGPSTCVEPQNQVDGGPNACTTNGI
jgi:hypothetical protein